MYTYEIAQDHMPINPREFDNMGTIVIVPNRDFSGDITPNQSDWDDEGIRLPIRAYIHSGVYLTADPVHTSSYPFNDTWDSAWVGYIYANRDKILSEFNTKRITQDIRKKVIQNLIAEIRIFSAYLSGDVWGCIIYENGEEIDSCWGFYSYEDAEESAKDTIAYLEHKFIEKAWLELPEVQSCL